MRGIKFRAWINALNCWADEIIISQVGDVWGYIAIKNDNKYFNADLEQFTCLRDKNGNEIYEGDIVEYGSVDGNHMLGSVVYNAPMFEVEPDYDKYSCSPIELAGYEMYYVKIIGNIHENKELLK